jgi:hypothetical protein
MLIAVDPRPVRGRPEGFGTQAGPVAGAAPRSYDISLLPHLHKAGFDETTALWEHGGNGHELLLLARRGHS